MNEASIVNLKTGEVLDPENLEHLRSTWEQAKELKKQCQEQMDLIKAILWGMTDEIETDSLTRRVKGKGSIAVVQETPKYQMDDVKIQKAKNALTPDQFNKYFDTITTYKLKLREWKKLGSMEAVDSKESEGMEAVKTSRVKVESYINIKWEEVK